jgi:dienelactone hydrolase
MLSANYVYQDGDINCHGFVSHDDNDVTAKPAVIVAHDWTGRNEFACVKAEKLAQMGYVGFALDMYGNGTLGADNDEKMTLMEPFIGNRALLGQRIKAAYEAVSQLEYVDKERIAVIGYCFGGLCALDLARLGVNIKGAVSFHGLLNKPDNANNQQINAKILALHGYDDPMVPPEQVAAFCDEMNQANVDWQIHMYGNTQHAFTNPMANDTELGTIYDEKADKRSWCAMKHFLSELF